MITSVIDNARQVLREGYVIGCEDGDEIHLHWLQTGGEVGERIAEGIIQLISDGEATVTDRHVSHGLYELELNEPEVTVDCE